MTNQPSGNMRAKVAKGEAKFLGELVERYESPREKKIRAMKLIYWLRHDPGFNKGTDPKKLMALAKEIGKSKSANMPMAKLMDAVGLKEDSELVQLISNITKNHTHSDLPIGAVDLAWKDPNIVLRVLPHGAQTKRIFALMIGDKPMYLIRYLGNVKRFSLNARHWDHLRDCRGSQRELGRYPEYIMEEYCGIDLRELSGTCECNSETERLARIRKKYFPHKHSFNIAYNADTGELVVIDAN